MTDETSLDTDIQSGVPEKSYEEDRNIFKELVPDAKRTLRRTMLMSRDNKLSAETAKDVLDRAGETKKVEERAQRPVVITNSQINLLLEVAKEVSEPEEFRNVSDDQ
jgi:hypothetical protein